MASRFILALCFILAVPVCGYLVAEWALLHAAGAIGQTPGDLARLCAIDPESASCAEFLRIALLRDASIWCGVCGVFLICFVVAAGYAAGTNRPANARIFPILVPACMVATTLFVSIQGAQISYIAYLLQVFLIGHVDWFLVGIIGLGVAAGCCKLIWATLQITKARAHSEYGRALARPDAPELWQFVEQLADRLDARLPDNIVVGLEPTFYATAARIDLPLENRQLTGETLFVSLPLLRLFNRSELAAVIGHELDHFQGGDTAYSKTFAPAFASLSHAADILFPGGRIGWGAVTKLPAAAMLLVLIDSFARNVKEISRIREFEADLAGAAVADPKSLAVALAKLAVFAPLWPGVRQENIDRLSNGRISRNLSLIFHDSTKYDISQTNIGLLFKQIVATQITHPTDSHPSIADRFFNLRFDPAALSVADLVADRDSAIDLIFQPDHLEEELTAHEHKAMIESGHVEAMDRAGEGIDTRTLNFLYTLAAAMVGADGRIVQEEVAVAETIGQELITGFDRLEFRDLFRDRPQIPDFEKAVDLLSGPIPQQEKRTIYTYLEQIADADGTSQRQEHTLLGYARRSWQLAS